MQNLVVLLFVVLMVAAVFMPLAKTRGGIGRIQARPLMTAREVEFWRHLIVAASPLHVAPQVAMGALLKVSGAADRGRARATRNRFDRKMVDFVLLDDDGVVRLLVELDDRTHSAVKDRERDAMTAQAGYMTYRVNGVEARDVTLLKAAIDERLGNLRSWSPPRFNPAISRHRARNMSARPSSPPA